jgi:hypothetical protein
MGARPNHIELPALYDLICGKAGMDADCRNHMENCQQCQADVSWLQWLSGFGVRERRYEPPAWAMTNAENIFRLKKPGLVTIAKEIVASLVYDSFSEPLPVGVRCRDLPSRQALYKADNLQLDLKIELGDEKGLIVGQIVADTGDMEFSGLQIEITQQGKVIGKSRINGLGEFIFQNLPKGDYELQVILSDTMVKLPPLPLGE